MAGDRLPRKVMDPKKLASLLRNGAEGTLVIDSRSFVEYNSWHVLSSVNICCSKLVKRRLQQDKVSITELIQPASKMKVRGLALACPCGNLSPRRKMQGGGMHFHPAMPGPCDPLLPPCTLLPAAFPLAPRPPHRAVLGDLLVAPTPVTRHPHPQASITGTSAPGLALRWQAAPQSLPGAVSLIPC